MLLRQAKSDNNFGFCYPVLFSIEYLNAALASILVESSTGSDDSPGSTIKGISVHPRITESHPSDLKSLITSRKYFLDPLFIIPYTSSLKIISFIFLSNLCHLFSDM